MKGAEELTPATLVPEAETYPEALTAAPNRTRLVGRWGFKLAGMLTATLAVTGMYQYQSDVNDERSMLANTHSYLQENSPPIEHTLLPIPVPRGVYEAMDPAQQAAIDDARHVGNIASISFSGVGKTQVPEGGAVLSPFDKLGANYSMVYDPKGVDTNNLLDTMNTITSPNGGNANNLIIYGNSAGAAIGTDAAVRLIEKNPSIRIKAILLDSAAIDPSVVSPESRAQALMMLESFKFIPGVENSRDARVLGEMIMKRTEIHDPASFVSTLNSTIDEVFNARQSTSNALSGDQYLAVEYSKVQKDLLALGRLPVDQRPLIFFIGATDPKRDDVVNVVKSYALLNKWTRQAGLVLADPIGVDNLFHGEPELSMKQYHSIFKNIVIPRISHQMSIKSQN